MKLDRACISAFMYLPSLGGGACRIAGSVSAISSISAIGTCHGFVVGQLRRWRYIPRAGLLECKQSLSRATGS